MKVSKEVAEDIVFGDEPNFRIILKKIVERQRWCIVYWCVVQDLLTSQYYSVSYAYPATEQQDGQDMFDSDPVEFEEVFPVDFVTTAYLTAEEKEEYERGNN